MVKEITNKSFRDRMKKERLNHVHLYKDCTMGYFFISSDIDNIYFTESSIYLNSFSQQSIDEWIRDIKNLVKKEI